MFVKNLAQSIRPFFSSSVLVKWFNEHCMTSEEYNIVKVKIRAQILVCFDSVRSPVGRTLHVWDGWTTLFGDSSPILDSIRSHYSFKSSSWWRLEWWWLRAAPPRCFDFPQFSLSIQLIKFFARWVSKNLGCCGILVLWYQSPINKNVQTVFFHSCWYSMNSFFILLSHIKYKL